MQQPENEIYRLGDIKVAASKRVKMDISNRAKQFMPFAALKGLPEALEKKERIMEQEIALEEVLDIETENNEKW